MQVARIVEAEQPRHPLQGVAGLAQIPLRELAARVVEQPLERRAFRAQAPLFLGQPVRLQWGEGEVRAVRCDGAIAMTAKVEYR